MPLSPLIRRFNRVQSKAVSKAVHLLEKSGRTLVVMTTGTGKTVVGCKIIKEFPRSKVLWLTQTEELIMQSFNDLSEMLGLGEVGLFKRGQRSLEERVIVASLQTIEKDENLNGIPRDFFDLIVVDEAHHAPANTWNKVLQYFKSKRLGLTATPERGDGKELEDLFGEMAIDLSYEDAKKYGLIAEEVYRLILTNSCIEGLVTKSGEYQPHELDKLVVSLDRNQIIVDSYKKHGRKFMREHNLPYKAICFCITVQHAIRMRDLFVRNDITSEILVSKHAHSIGEHGSPLTEKERGEVYESFVRGTGPEVLCVVNVLNEGKNIPDVGCLMLARPTRSSIIFSQQMGRGCRRIERKKEKFMVLDFVDQINKRYPPMTLSKITGVDYEPSQFDITYFRGKDPIVVDEFIQYLSHAYEYRVVKSKTKKKKAVKNLKKIWTKMEVEAALKKWAADHGGIKVTDLGEKNKLPSQKTVYKYWGTWRKCEEALEFSTWDKDKIRGAIAQFRKLKSRDPRDYEFTSQHGLPSVGTVRRLFKNLTNVKNF